MWFWILWLKSCFFWISILNIPPSVHLWVWPLFSSVSQSPGVSCILISTCILFTSIWYWPERSFLFVAAEISSSPNPLSSKRVKATSTQLIMPQTQGASLMLSSTYKGSIFLFWQFLTFSRSGPWELLPVCLPVSSHVHPSHTCGGIL